MRSLLFRAMSCVLPPACARGGDPVGSEGSAAAITEANERTTSTSRFSYEDLVGLIKGRGFTSIEEVLPALPEDFRSNYTLMYASGRDRR